MNDAETIEQIRQVNRDLRSLDLAFRRLVGRARAIRNHQREAVEQLSKTV